MTTPAPSDADPIGDDELLYCRVPVSVNWFDPVSCPKLSPRAFRPRSVDVTGLSVVRGHPFNTVEEAARGSPGKAYYVAVLCAKDLREHGIVVVPKPDPTIRGHAEITSITAANRDADEGRIILELLAHQLCLRVEGPFHQDK